MILKKRTRFLVDVLTNLEIEKSKIESEFSTNGITTDILDRIDYKNALFSSYSKCLVILSSEHPGGASGIFRVVEEIHQTRLDRYLMIIVCHNNRSYKTGYNAYVLKPFNFNQVSFNYLSLEEVGDFIYTQLINYEIGTIKNVPKFAVSLEFPKEHKQAGLQILNYFQETLNQKYPDNDVTVRIGQKGNTVTMEIETPDGEKETYKKAFEEYGLVVTGQKPVEEYLENPVDQAELRSQLRLAQAQLESKRDLLLMKDQVISTQKTQLEYFQSELSKQLASGREQTSRILDLAENALANDHEMNALFSALDEDLASGDAGSVKAELEKLKEEKPTAWKAVQAHAYEIGKKATYTVGSEQLIALIGSM